MREPVDLRPCPFCGGRAWLVEVDEGMWSLTCHHDRDCVLADAGLEDMPIEGEDERDMWELAWDRRVK